MKAVKLPFFTRRAVPRRFFTVLALSLVVMFGSDRLLPGSASAALIWCVVACIWIRMATGRLIDANIHPGWSFPLIMLIVAIRELLPDSLTRDVSIIAVQLPLMLIPSQVVRKASGGR